MADLTTAFIGFGGVVVGAFITMTKDVWMHRSNQKRESVFLSIRVMALLDRFADDCMYVAQDSGEWDHGGQHFGATTKTPDFNPGSVDVQWKTLPPLLLHRIMDLPQQIVTARALLSHIEDVAWDPPEHPEYSEERRIQFATLGLEALDLSSTLRLRSGLPQRSTAAWDPARELRKLKDEVQAVREARYARITDLMARLDLHKSAD